MKLGSKSNLLYPFVLLGALLTACGGRTGSPNKPTAVTQITTSSTSEAPDISSQQSTRQTLPAEEKKAIDDAVMQLEKKVFSESRHNGIPLENVEMVDTPVSFDKASLKKLRQAIEVELVRWHTKMQSEREFVLHSIPDTPVVQNRCLRYQQFKKECLLNSLIEIDLPRALRIVPILKDLSRQISACRNAGSLGRFATAEDVTIEETAYEDVLKQLVDKEIQYILGIPDFKNLYSLKLSVFLEKNNLHELELWRQIVTSRLSCLPGPHWRCNLSSDIQTGHISDIPNDFELRAQYYALLTSAHFRRGNKRYPQTIQEGLAYLESDPIASKSLSADVRAAMYWNAAEYYEHIYDFENARIWYNKAGKWMEISGAFSKQTIGNALLKAADALHSLEITHLDGSPKSSWRQQASALWEKGWRYFEEDAEAGRLNRDYFQTGLNTAMFLADIDAPERALPILETLRRNESNHLGNATVAAALCAIQIHLGLSEAAQADIDHYRDTSRLKKKASFISHMIETQPSTPKIDRVSPMGGVLFGGAPSHPRDPPPHPAEALIDELNDDIADAKRFFETLVDSLIRVHAYGAAHNRSKEREELYREIESIAIKKISGGVHRYKANWADLFYSKGRISLKSGDLDTAMQYFRKAQAAYEQGNEFSYNALRMLFYQHIVSERQGAPKADKLFQQGISLLRKKEEKYRSLIPLQRISEIANIYTIYGHCDRVKELNAIRLSLCNTDYYCEEQRRDAEFLQKQCAVNHSKHRRP